MKKKHSAKFDFHSENFGLIRSDKIKQCQKTLYCHAEFISASSHRQAEMSNSQKLPLPAGSKGKQRGTSCVPLLAEQRGWGEELTSNSAPIKQLQKPNGVTSPVASIFCAQVCAPYSDCLIRGRIDKQKRSAFTLAEGATHVANFVDGRKAAFTLAEVLITLGIIGIVAAMTLPTLMASNKEKARVTNLKKIYSQMQNAWNMAIAENGDAINWDLAQTNTGTTNEDGATILDHSGREKFMSYLLPYFKVTKDVTLNYEGDYSLDGRKFGEAMSIKTDGSGTSGEVPMTIVTPDGFLLSMGWISAPNSAGRMGDFWVVLPNERKKITGVTIFHFDINSKKGFVPTGGTQTEFARACDVKNKTLASDQNGRTCTAWALQMENMEYMKCNDLSFSGKKKCH